MAASNLTKSPAFQFYPRDFFSSAKVDAMSMTERGVYITLLGRCWLDHGLPIDLAQLAKLARMKLAQFDRMWKSGTLHECFYERGGKLQNERLDHERKVQADYRRKQSVNGAKGGRPRNPEKPTASSGLTQPKPNESSSFSSSSASASASTPPNGGVVTARPAPLVQQRRKDAAFESGRLYVPMRAHNDLMMLGNHPDGEKGLFAWYERICEAWTHGPHKAERIAPDLIGFWKARYADEWPPVAAKTAGARKWDNWQPREATK